MVFLFLLVVVEVGVAVLTLIFREEFLVGLDERLSDQLVNKYGLDITNHYQSNNVANKDITNAVDFAQYRVGAVRYLAQLVEGNRPDALLQPGFESGRFHFHIDLLTSLNMPSMWHCKKIYLFWGALPQKQG